MEQKQTISNETPVIGTFPIEADNPGLQPDVPDYPAKQNGVRHDDHDQANAYAAEDNHTSLPEDTSSDPERRLEAATQERIRLKVEVMELRESLESIQRRHEEEIAGSQRQLEVAELGRDHAQDQYQKLLGKVNTIKTQLGERLKADAVSCLSTRSRSN